MVRLLVTGLVAAMLLSACGSGEDIPAVPGAPGNGTGDPTDPRNRPDVRKTSGVDLSTPAAAVQSFCAAAAAGDIPRTGACIASDPGEAALSRIRNGQVTDDEMAEGRALALRGIVGTELAPDGTGAWVQVMFMNGGGETFYCVKERDGWKVSDF